MKSSNAKEHLCVHQFSLSTLSNHEATATFHLWFAVIFSIVSIVNCNSEMLPREKLGLILMP